MFQIQRQRTNTIPNRKIVKVWKEARNQIKHKCSQFKQTKNLKGNKPKLFLHKNKCYIKFEIKNLYYAFGY